MAISSKEGYDHQVFWMNVGLRLNQIGYWVKWQDDRYGASKQYAIGRKGEAKPMGIYNEEEANGMVKMLLSNAKHEEP